ncbi:hypothetical protein ACN20G_15660 [Streptomyces sp. BI20]|uniref:hypothetical protein n=1 Tax=Streptomyces sp. BI20 TaxID=3403460 RepID=UPI003C778B31
MSSSTGEASGPSAGQGRGRASARDEALVRFERLARERAFGLDVGSDRLIFAGPDVLLADVDSPSLALLAGLTRAEEPAARALFDLVTEESVLSFRPPEDPRERRWALARWIAARVVDGSWDPAAGVFTLAFEIGEDLGRPGELARLVECAHLMEAWDWGERPRNTTHEQCVREAVEAARRFLERRPATTTPAH